jgi:hypothetical protein
MHKNIHSADRPSELTAPQHVALSVESVWLIGSRAATSTKQPRADSDLDLLFVLGRESNSALLELMNELPRVVQHYQHATLELSGTDSFGSLVWDAVAGEQGATYLREYGERALRAHGLSPLPETPIDIFVTVAGAEGACVRLAWQAIPEDDGQGTRWEGLGYLSLGAAWQSSAQQLV